MILGVQWGWEDEPARWVDGNLESARYFGVLNRNNLEHTEQIRWNFSHFIGGKIQTRYMWHAVAQLTEALL